MGTYVELHACALWTFEDLGSGILGIELHVCALGTFKDLVLDLGVCLSIELHACALGTFEDLVQDMGVRVLTFNCMCVPWGPSRT